MQCQHSVVLFLVSFPWTILNKHFRTEAGMLMQTLTTFMSTYFCSRSHCEYQFVLIPIVSYMYCYSHIGMFAQLPVFNARVLILQWVCTHTGSEYEFKLTLCHTCLYSILWASICTYTNSEYVLLLTQWYVCLCIIWREFNSTHNHACSEYVLILQWVFIHTGSEYDLKLTFWKICL